MKLRTKIIAVVSAIALSLVGWAIPATAADYSGLRVLQSLYKEVEPEASPSASEESSDPPPPEGGEDSAPDDESVPAPKPAAEEQTEAPEPEVKESSKSSEKTEKNTEAPEPEAKESSKSSEKTEKNTEDPEANEPSESDQPESKATESAPSTQEFGGDEPKVCPDDAWYDGKRYGDKVDTRGDPSSVEVTAPAGRLIAGYCVKAGKDLDFVPVNPPQKKVTITDEDDDKDVSHYSLVLVNDSKVYYCAPKSEGSDRWKVHTFYTSDEIPAWVTEAGYVVKKHDSHCEPPVEVCENLLSDGTTLEDIEATLPAGVEIREKDNGDCYYYVYVCWQITNGTDDIKAGEKAAVNGSHFPQTWAGEAASKDAVLSLEGCAPTPVCTDSTWWQVDKYKIENASDHEVLEQLRGSGTLEWLGSKASDHDIWTPLKQHWIIEVQGDYTDCTNSKTVQVCVPDDNAPSGYVQGLLTWTYTKDENGEGYTTDMDVPHPAFTVLNHLGETYATVDAHDDWNQEFYDKGCANMTEVCVPVGESNGAATVAFTNDTPTGPQNPWTVMEVTEEQANTKYANNPRPNDDGYCEFKVFVCWEIVSGDDDPVQLNNSGNPLVNKANFTPPQKFIEWGWSFEDLEQCWQPEQLCGPGTWYQLDRYLIENEDELNHLITLMTNGLGWHDGKPGDQSPHRIYDGKHYFFYTGNGEDCTNSGTVPVCVPVGDSGTKFVPGTITWTFTRGAEGDSFTTDPEDLSGYLHAGFQVLTHEDPAAVHHTEPATWEGEGSFADFLRNKCKNPKEYCPVELTGDASEWEPVALYPWEKDWRVNYTRWTGDPEDCFDPKGKVTVCYPDKHADDGWSQKSIAWWAQWTSDDDWKFRGLWWLGIAPFDTADELFPGWSLESRGVIVPPISSEHYGITVSHSGVNWTPLNQAIYGTGCDPVDEIVDVDLVHVTCEDPDGGGIDATYRVATGNGNVQVRLYRLVDGEKVYLNANGTPAEMGTMPLLHEVVEGAGEHNFSANGLTHGTYGFETVDENHQATYGGEFVIERPEEECATLGPDILSGICVDGIPYMDFTIEVADPLDEVDLSQGAVITLSDTEGEGAPFTHEMTPIPLVKATQGGITYSYDEATKTHTWEGEVLWPGANVEPPAWPGWAFDEATGTYVNVGTDNFGWTRDGMTVTVKVNPEAEFEADVYPSEEPDCPNPPSYDICEWDSTENMPVQTTLYGTAPEDAVLWIDGSECTPVVICELLSGEPETGEYGEMTIMKSEYDPEVHQMWNPDAEVQGGCREAQEPTLAGSLLSSVCVADSPWLTYNVDLEDPDSQSTDSGIATITFVHPTDESQNVVMEVPIGAGYVMWPGASVAPAEGYTEADIDPTNPATFVPTGWPGWAQDASGEWVSIGLENFGWTRYGIEVRLDVNPSTSLTVNYPPPTPTCVSSPPAQTVTTEAPAATPVAARVITYTG